MYFIYSMFLSLLITGLRTIGCCLLTLLPLNHSFSTPTERILNNIKQDMSNITLQRLNDYENTIIVNLKYAKD